MTTDEVRDKAIALLASRVDGRRIEASVVMLKDGSTFTGVLMERAHRRTRAGVGERLGFTLESDELRYCGIETIESM